MRNSKIRQVLMQQVIDEILFEIRRMKFASPERLENHTVRLQTLQERYEILKDKQKK